MFFLCFQVGLLTVTLVYHIFSIYGSILILEVRKLLQRQEGHVDVSLLATCEQVREQHVIKSSPAM